MLIHHFSIFTFTTNFIHRGHFDTTFDQTKVVEENENIDDVGQRWEFLFLGENNLGLRYKITIGKHFLTGSMMKEELTIQGKKL